MNKLAYKSTNENLLSDLIESYENICEDLETKIERYGRLLIMGQETGGGGFKYEIEGAERLKVQKEMNEYIRALNYYDDQVYIMRQVIKEKTKECI